MRFNGHVSIGLCTLTPQSAWEIDTCYGLSLESWPFMLLIAGSWLKPGSAAVNDKTP